MSYRKPKRGDPGWKPGAGIWRTCIICRGFAPRGEMKQVKDGKRIAYRHRGDCRKRTRQGKDLTRATRAR